MMVGWCRPDSYENSIGTAPNAIVRFWGWGQSASTPPARAGIDKDAIFLDELVHHQRQDPCRYVSRLRVDSNNSVCVSAFSQRQPIS
jgi:hypothetical protein